MEASLIQSLKPFVLQSFQVYLGSGSTAIEVEVLEQLMIALYDFTLSGNCYKVRHATPRFGVQSDSGQIEEGEQGKRNFKRHPFGKVPFWWITTL